MGICVPDSSRSYAHLCWLTCPFEAGLFSFKHFLICEGCKNAVFSHSFETEQHFFGSRALVGSVCIDLFSLWDCSNNFPFI